MAESKRDEDPFKLPPLRLIEEEGRKAADELAQEILRETMAAGGRLDLQRLGRAGPSVQAAYMHLLSHATVPSAQAESANPREAGMAQPRQPTKPHSVSPAKPRLLHRTKVGWRDRQCPDIGFAVRGFRYGLAVAAVLGALAVLATRALQF